MLVGPRATAQCVQALKRDWMQFDEDGLEMYYKQD
jgi:hypothetical protein